MSDLVVKIENLSKYYRLGLIGGGTLREDVSRWWANIRGRPSSVEKIGEIDHGNRKDGHIWALHEVSMEIRQGEILGIIGGNGAGKSTLLKILSHITAPTGGRIMVKGRIGSLLEVGTGFHPELTGQENIYLNGAILGMSKKEVSAKLDEIVDFSGMEEFIDTPVKRYSSGMSVRLAFSVAAHLEPEILVVDEVLAVGDASFQKKCIGKMDQVSRCGRTILFVSHNMSSIANLCHSAIWLDKGRVRLDGAIDQVLPAYISSQFDGKRTFYSNNEPISAKAMIRRVRILNDLGEQTIDVSYVDAGTVEIEYESVLPEDRLVIAVRIVDALGNTVLTSWDFDYKKLNKRSSDVLRCCLPKEMLKPGNYSLVIVVHELISSNRVAEQDSTTLHLTVLPKGYPASQGRIGLIMPVLRWSRASCVTK